MVYLGIDWAEAHHDMCLLDETGVRLSKARVPDGIEGLARIHELVAVHTSNPDTVVVGIETDRGLLVQGLVATGYQVYALEHRCCNSETVAWQSLGQALLDELAPWDV